MGTQLFGGARRRLPVRRYDFILAILVAAAIQAPSVRGAEPQILDAFDDLSGWTAAASQGASIEIAQDRGTDGMGLRIDFDFHGGAGYVLVHKALPLALPENYAFSFDIRGEAPRNDFEFKLVDRSGKSVWWRRLRDFAFPSSWEHQVIRKPRIEFAWGPAHGGELKQVGAIEFGISAGSGGGKGSVWIDTLAFEQREPASAYNHTATVLASTSLPGHEPELILDQDPATSWHSGTVAPGQWVIIDFGKTREYGGLVIDWDESDFAIAYEVQVSDDQQSWTTAYTSTAGNGGRDYIYMPDAESRYVRLKLQQSSIGSGYGIRDVTVKPFEFSASPNQFFRTIAQEGKPGLYPKYFYDRQTYWTVVGVNGDSKEALLNEEGMLEVEKGGFSIEPFLYADGHLVGWSDVQTSQELDAGYLPIPSVIWRSDQLSLRITVFASGPAEQSVLYARYHLENAGAEFAHVALFLAIRPFQVVPPWQSLNMVGGVSLIHSITLDGRIAWVNHDKPIISLTAPERSGTSIFERGPVVDFLAGGRVPPQAESEDPFGFASGAFQYGLDLQPGGVADVDIAIPFHEVPSALAPGVTAVTGEIAGLDVQLQKTEDYWRSALDRVDYELPPAAVDISRTAKTTLAYILINRDGAAIQPGSRSYARSWIRDGALTSASLLELGFTEEVREFLRWYSGYQYHDGKIPCCVDYRGADPTPEYDSNGEFIFAVMDYYRFTRDVGFLSEMWPHVIKAVDYLERLRQQTMTDAYTNPDKQAFYGLLPESISHEGYASHPVHSYWDDFFALRGLKDAARMAVIVGDTHRAAQFAALRDAFRKDLYSSIDRVVQEHHLDYVPASADLGDFDPNATAIALIPGGEYENMPPALLEHTFDRYFDAFEKRAHGEGGWDSYTPYELRNVAALVLMGERDRAVEVLRALMADRHPTAWNEWPEIVWRDRAAPRFIGDMPHTWVGSAFLRSLRTLFAFEREADGSLVIGAGLPWEWVSSETGVSVERMPTQYGVLHLAIRSESAGSVTVRLSGDLTMPPGGIIVQPPLPEPLKSVHVNGIPIGSFGPDQALVRSFPAEVVLEY